MNCECGGEIAVRGLCRSCYQRTYRSKTRYSRYCAKYDKDVKITHHAQKVKRGLKHNYRCPDDRESPCRIDCVLFTKFSPEDVYHIAKKVISPKKANQAMRYYQKVTDRMNRSLREHFERQGYKQDTGMNTPCAKCYAACVAFCGDNDFECHDFRKFVSG